MFTETAQRFKSAAPLLAQTALLSEPRITLTHGRVRNRRHFNVSPCLGRLVRHVEVKKKPPAKVVIPGLERITWADRMHYVPGLAKPEFPRWSPEQTDPWQLKWRKVPEEEHRMYKKKPCYVFQQRTNLTEGVRQALWLTKSQMVEGLPPSVSALVESPACRIEDQDERVQNAINHARFWNTTKDWTTVETLRSGLLHNLLHLCGRLQLTHPGMGRRMLAEKHNIIASWNRGEELFQVRGRSGLLLNSQDPLPVVAGREQVHATAEHVLEKFYPISPTIDLERVHLYEETNITGFKENYPYPHPHTLFFIEERMPYKVYPEPLRAKLIMFAFGNALAKARATQAEPGELERPIVVQAVGHDGRLFQYVVFQLNTTALQDDGGVKNLVWLDQDQPLYDTARLKAIIVRKKILIPAGLAGYNPQTFQKFMALNLHGAA